MADPVKVAVVTPYYIQAEPLLRQCQESVLGQTHTCTHIPVADGHPSPIFDEAPRTLHVVLPRSNRDYGNTPRAIGGILAASYGFDAIALLDDDNWFEPEHIETMLAAHQASGAPLISCLRQFRHLDGAALAVTEPLEDRFAHVDANCWLIFRPAFALLETWRVPRAGSHRADRIFLQRALRERYRVYSTKKRTVNYRTKYPNHYLMAGLAVPEGAYRQEEIEAQGAAFRTAEGVKEMIDAIGFVPTAV